MSTSESNTFCGSNQDSRKLQYNDTKIRLKEATIKGGNHNGELEGEDHHERDIGGALVGGIAGGVIGALIGHLPICAVVGASLGLFGHQNRNKFTCDNKDNKNNNNGRNKYEKENNTKNRYDEQDTYGGSSTQLQGAVHDGIKLQIQGWS